MRRCAKVDANHVQIVRELRQLGYTVLNMQALGSGAPDIAVGKRNLNYFFEIKARDQPPSKRKLTDDERAWHAAWLGQVNVIESTEDALRIMVESR